MKRVFILAHETARRRAQEYIWDAPDGYRVEVSEPKKKRMWTLTKLDEVKALNITLKRLSDA